MDYSTMLRYLPFWPRVKAKCFTQHANVQFLRRAHRAFGRDITSRDWINFVRDAAKAVYFWLAKCAPANNGCWGTTWKWIKIVTSRHPTVHGMDKEFCVVTVC